MRVQYCLQSKKEKKKKTEKERKEEKFVFTLNSFGDFKDDISTF